MMALPHIATIQHFLSGSAVYAVLAYAARTLPEPQSPWGAWFIGVIQFALSNADRGKSAMTLLSAPPLNK